MGINRFIRIQGGTAMGKDKEDFNGALQLRSFFFMLRTVGCEAVYDGCKSCMCQNGNAI